MDIAKTPVLVFTTGLVLLWLAARVGARLRRKPPTVNSDEGHDLDMIVTASLTLLALIIGFSFSMAVTRYDQRKNYEAEEANAIGTEYFRVGLLPPEQAKRARELLRTYVARRISFYTTGDRGQLEQINTSTAQLQSDLWSVVQEAAATQPTPVVALAVSGMNDVLNSQGYAQAAWWNHIPAAAWGLMAAIAIFSNLLVGYDTRQIGDQARRLYVLPLIVSIAFFLISEMDSPRGGFVRVQPQNLEHLALSVR